jgi:hypothetical protein
MRRDNGGEDCKEWHKRGRKILGMPKLSALPHNIVI